MIFSMYDALGGRSPIINRERDAGYATADATAARETADIEAADNRATAERTNSLAARLASARRTPGGGLRSGMRRRGLSANSAGAGLNRANAAGRLERRQTELRAQSEDRLRSDFNARFAARKAAAAPMQGFTIYR